MAESSPLLPCYTVLGQDEIFEKKFKKKYGGKSLKFVKKIVQDYSAIISGGSVLSCVDFDNHENNQSPKFTIGHTHDIDIYVQVEKAKELIQEMIKANLKSIAAHIAPLYDQSFFRKNHILYRISFAGEIDGTRIVFDVIVVDKAYDLQTIVTNFDLMCCEIWYKYNLKGNNYIVQTQSEKHYEAIKTKQTYLRNDYFKCLLEHSNWFIIQRLQKYKYRGFTIKFGTPDYDTKNQKIEVNSLTVQKRNEKTTVDCLKEKTYYYQEWLARKLIKSFLLYGESASYDANRLLNSISLVCDYFHPNPDPNPNPHYIYPMSKFNDLYLIKMLKKPENPRDNQQYTKKVKWFSEIITNTLSSLMTMDNQSGVPTNHKIIAKYYQDNLLQASDPSLTIQKYTPTVEYSIVFDKVFDCIMYTDVDKEEWKKDKDNVIFIIPENKPNGEGVALTSLALGFSKEYLLFLYNNKADNWFYECEGDVFPGTNDKPTKAKDLTQPYCGIPVSSDGMKGLVSTRNLKTILSHEKTDVDASYVLQYEEVFTHTISHKNTNNDAPNFVSANHCQGGSTYIVYDILHVSHKIASKSWWDWTNCIDDAGGIPK